MTSLNMHFLGNLSVYHDKQLQSIKMTHVTQTLFTYLVLQRQRVHHRDALASLLWGEQPEHQAKNCLNTALWRLRNALEPAGIRRGTYIVTTLSGDVGFNTESEFWADFAELESTAESVLSRPGDVLCEDAATKLEQAIRLYNGDLLDGFYDDWVLRERERLRDLYLRSLAQLMYYHKTHQNFDTSIGYAQQILVLDPLREDIQREVMRLYLANGQRALAARQFELCCQVLATELGIPPMEETKALYSEIVPESASPLIPLPSTPNPANLGQALHHLRLTLQHFKDAQDQLHSATKLVEQYALLHNR